MTDPLGNTEYDTYDKNERMTEKTDRDGYMTAFAYDHAGKVTDILYADGRSVKLSYSTLHQLEQVKDWLGSTDITLDTLGRPLSVTDSYGQTVGYEWRIMGERKTLTYSDGTRAYYEYDEAMHLSKLHTPASEISYAYDKAGRLCEKQLPGGAMTQYAYNSLGRIAQISHVEENVHERYTYHYDAAGNKVGADKMRGGSATWEKRISCNEKSIVNGNEESHVNGNILDRPLTPWRYTERKRPDLLLGWECRQYAGRWRGKFLLAGRSWKPDGTA